MGRRTAVDTKDKSTDTKLPNDYNTRLALAKLAQLENDAERLRLANVKAQNEIAKTGGNLCYIHVAVTEFEGALRTFNEALNDVENTLTQKLVAAKTAERPRLVANEFNRLRTLLHGVDIKLSTTEETDAATAHDNAAVKRLKRGS